MRKNFCPGSKGCWTETNLTRFDTDKAEGRTFFVNEYAYPLNTIGKQEKIKELLDHAAAKNIIGLGRWGQWQHFNSDVVIKKALELGKRLLAR